MASHAVHCIFTASTIRSNLASANISYKLNTRAYLGQYMSFLKEMGETWPSGSRYLHFIRSLIAKYRIRDNFATSQPTVVEEEETSPKNYICEERSE